MNSIQEIVNNKISEMCESGEIQKKIEESISGAIESAIESQFRSYGDVTKQIELAFKEGLKIDTSNVEFDTYNMVMLSSVKMKLDQYFAEDASSKFMKQLDEMFQPAPKEMDIHDLVNQVAELWKSDNESYYDWEDSANAEYDTERKTLNMWVNDTSKYGSSKAKELNLYLYGGEIRISHKMKYNPTAMFGDDAFIFRLYSAGTKITGIDKFDEDDCELFVGMDDDY